MAYSINKHVQDNFETVTEKVRELLQKEGFGVLTEIDVDSVLKNKINVDFRKYKILGACNPTYAHKALLLEDKIGTMLPCNVVIQQHESGDVEVVAVDPIASMIAVENSTLLELAEEVREKLHHVIDGL